MEISISKGLIELKLLDSRINNAINDAKFIVAYKKSAKKVNVSDTPEEFANKAKSSMQSINDLIERRKQIKALIVDSNAKTMVTVAGKTMSVASAIERKESIKYEEMLLASMERQYSREMSIAISQNENVSSQLDNLLNNTFGRENRTKITSEEIEAISNPYKAQNEFDVLDVLKIANKIKELKDDILNFKSEVDNVLTESNVLTKITITD